jgi:hypothetical protein
LPFSENHPAITDRSTSCRAAETPSRLYAQARANLERAVCVDERGESDVTSVMAFMRAHHGVPIDIGPCAQPKKQLNPFSRRDRDQLSRAVDVAAHQSYELLRVTERVARWPKPWTMTRRPARRSAWLPGGPPSCGARVDEESMCRGAHRSRADCLNTGESSWRMESDEDWDGSREGPGSDGDQLATSHDRPGLDR